MELSQLNGINKLDLYEAGASGNDVTVYWLMATRKDTGSTLNYRMHRHTFFEVHFILSGDMSYGFLDRTLEVKEGFFTVVTSGTSHRVASHSEDFFKLTLAVDARAEAFESLKSLSGRAIRIGDELYSAIEAIGCYANSHNKYAAQIVKARLAEIIYLIASKGGERTESRESTDFRVFKAKKYIEDNPDIFLSCEEIAAYCNLSVKQLGRLFRSYEGESLLSYIHKVKINLAEVLIRETEEPFERIANKLGFSDASYFYKFFCRMRKMTPRQYREEARRTTGATV